MEAKQEAEAADLKKTHAQAGREAVENFARAHDETIDQWTSAITQYETLRWRNLRTAVEGRRKQEKKREGGDGDTHGGANE